MHSANEAVACVVIGSCKDGVPLFRENHRQNQRLEVTGCSMPTGVGVIGRIGFHLTNRSQGFIEVVRPRPAEKHLCGIDDDAFVSMYVIAKRCGTRQALASEVRTENIAENK